MAKRLRLAVVGSGISGLALAHTLHDQADISLFEAADYFGGHTHTVDITLPGPDGQPISHGVDTGFLVYNQATYPNLINLFANLEVLAVKSDMSFSVQTQWRGQALEWSGSSLNTVFAQRANLLRGDFWRMLADLLRFNALATRLARQGLQGRETALQQPLGAFLRQHRFSAAFCDNYLLPMIACIWSCPAQQMLEFPVASLLRFCHNHGLLQITRRPQWFSVIGGARNYVQRIVARLSDARLNTPVQQIHRDADGVTVVSARGSERFDKVVLATHSDQALALLADPSPAEQAVLGAIRYHSSRAVLHTDASVLPTRRLAWAAWNYERAATPEREAQQVCLHYLINKLQPLPWRQPVLVSLNPLRPIAARHILGEYAYSHPVLNLDAVAAQHEVEQLQGQQHSYFCGAWMGYGFHEDGLKAGLSVARRLLLDINARPRP